MRSMILNTLKQILLLDDADQPAITRDQQVTKAKRPHLSCVRMQVIQCLCVQDSLLFSFRTHAHADAQTRLSIHALMPNDEPAHLQARVRRDDACVSPVSLAANALSLCQRPCDTARNGFRRLRLSTGCLASETAAGLKVLIRRALI